jgi:hypothetical protein
MSLSFPRSRDLIIFKKGDTLPVSVDPELLESGWSGGQGVRYVTGFFDRPTVSISRGRYGGFLLWGSDESADQFTSLTRNQLVYQTAVMGFGGWVISTSSYERYTYASRQVGPLVPLVYNPNDILYFSLRGYWTKEDELTLSGSPEGPCINCGYVACVPKESTSWFLGVQTAC